MAHGNKPDFIPKPERAQGMVDTLMVRDPGLAKIICDLQEQFHDVHAEHHNSKKPGCPYEELIFEVTRTIVGAMVGTVLDNDPRDNEKFLEATLRAAIAGCLDATMSMSSVMGTGSFLDKKVFDQVVTEALALMLQLKLKERARAKRT